MPDNTFHRATCGRDGTACPTGEHGWCPGCRVSRQVLVTAPARWHDDGCPVSDGGMGNVFADLEIEQVCRLADAFTAELDGTDLRETWSLREMHPSLYDELHLRALALAKVEGQIAKTALIGLRKVHFVRQATDELR